MNLGFTEMLFIFVAALLIFGPKKLPEIGRQIGKALAEFRRASNEFKSQLESEMRQIEFEEMLHKQKQSAPAVLPAPEGTVESGNLEPQAEVLAETPVADPETFMQTGNLEFPAEAPAEAPVADPETPMKSEAAQGPNA